MKNRKLRKSMLICALLGAFCISLFRPDYAVAEAAGSSEEIRGQIEELEDQRESIEEELALLEDQMTENISQMEDAVAQKRRIDQQVTLLCEKIENINEQISAYSVMIADKQDDLREAQTKYDALKATNIARIRAMEEEGSLSYWSVLFKASSFSDFLDRLNMIEEIAAADHRRLTELNEAAMTVENAEEMLKAEKTALEETKLELDQAKVDLEQKRQEANLILTDLIARGEAYQKMMEEAETAKSDLLHDIAAKEADYDNAVYQEWLATYVPPATAQPSEEGENSQTTESDGNNPAEGDTNHGLPQPEDTWLLPLNVWYMVTSPFGPRDHPILGYVRMHEGIDLGCNEGSPILATRSGLVTTAEEDDACGNYVVINHLDGYSSIYMHMTYYIVSAGEYVTQGQVIGYVGETGLADGPHLHFGIARNGEYVNPAEYISFS